MCIHKPTLNFDEVVQEKVISMLRQYVDKKGVLQDANQLSFRRPRTCVMTASECRISVDAADVVYIVSHRGIRQIEAAKLDEELLQEHVVSAPLHSAYFGRRQT
eukprot:gnl/TRDRNA2_/TRDRNA2_121782_c0_seq1.p1 gnl/TRDRNA2_/TRDRNA2_121782_c0~~gnl/TRDRNA2_/TRDRNA2_121782_c0_seq1.p1  ORF type:complete len:104 (+),score=11.34 gnl/TRDRNA2_/TRDRNA2_121782_c0_seq1:2-313(+)